MPPALGRHAAPSVRSTATIDRSSTTTTARSASSAGDPRRTIQDVVYRKDSSSVRVSSIGSCTRQLLAHCSLSGGLRVRRQYIFPKHTGGHPSLTAADCPHSRRKAMKLRQEQFSLLLALGFLLLLSSTTADAQVTTADLVGTIKDSSGAVVPGVTVALTNEATGVSRSATTGDGGTYIFTSLQPGRYRLTAEVPGFRKVERTGVELQVNQRAQVDLELEVGAGRRDRPDRGHRTAARKPVVRARQRDSGEAGAGVAAQRTQLRATRHAQLPACRAQAPACAARS